MTTVAVAVLVTAQSAFALLLLVHGLLQLHLLRRAAAERRRRRTPDGGAAKRIRADDAQWPPVTVQLPLFNERYHAAGAIDAAAELCYPGRLEIQVLDDSTDDTTAIAAARASYHRTRGASIRHLHRAARDSYKAGALAGGAALAEGDLIAVFDADFRPERDFLRRMVPEFDDPAVGMVQARWSFSNEGENVLTGAQSIMLNAHFDIEQRGRSAVGAFINFNGSAGIWRAAAIRDAGGWSAQTLTEDVDLSYRAQLAGWRFVYRDDVHVRSLLPADIGAVRRQQHRWMRGVAQNARRLLPTVLRSPLPLERKVHAGAHLLESCEYGAVVGIYASTSAMLLLRGWEPAGVWPFVSPVMMAAFAAVAAPYVRTRARLMTPAVSRSVFLARLGAFFVLTLGLSLSNAIAAAGGAVRHRIEEFERTPKAPRSSQPEPGYESTPRAGTLIAEMSMCLFLAASVGQAVHAGVAPLAWLPALALLSIGIVLASSVSVRGR